jgi:hypothetical protein
MDMIDKYYMKIYLFVLCKALFPRQYFKCLPFPFSQIMKPLLPHRWWMISVFASSLVYLGLESRQGHTKESRQGHTKESRQGHIKESRQGHTKESRQGHTKESRQGHTKDNSIGVCCLFTKNALCMSKNKYWNHNNVSKWVARSTHALLCQWATTINNAKLALSSSDRNVICSPWCSSKFANVTLNNTH